MSQSSFLQVGQLRQMEALKVIRKSSQDGREYLGVSPVLLAIDDHWIWAMGRSTLVRNVQRVLLAE